MTNDSEKPKFRLIHGGGGKVSEKEASDAARMIMEGIAESGRAIMKGYYAENLHKLGRSMRDNWAEFSESYSSLSEEDIPLFKLEVGLQTIQGLANFRGSLDEFVLYNTEDFTKIGGDRYRRNQSTRVADGLQILEMAHLLALPEGQLDSDLKNFRHFVDKNCPSPVWEDATNTYLLMELIQGSREIVKIVSQREEEPEVIKKLRKGFMGPNGAGLTSMDEREMSNARVLAWQNWPDNDDGQPISFEDFKKGRRLE